jgi:hypothetical protein
VVVKAAPVITSDLDETVCVAAVSADSGLWVRLHPVPFRDLVDDSKFKKYQRITVDVIPHKTDRRPETVSPIHGTIQPGEYIRSNHQWAARRPWIECVGERLMCDLVRENRGGSGPGVTSLAVVRPESPPKLVITPRDPQQVNKWKSRAEVAAASPSLFDDPTVTKVPYEVVPWRFKYRYKCQADGCGGHEQTIVDWEAVAYWHRVRRSDHWQQSMIDKFERELWTKRDSVLFVGNMEQHPWDFLVLGVFWPPQTATQAAFRL